MKDKRTIRIATCQFSENWSPRRNASLAIRYMRRARRMRADVVHFHEGALSGYRGMISSAGYDWASLRLAAQAVAAEALRLGLWVILGSAHPLTPPHLPHNSLYLISPAGELIDRYDKRFLMPNELDVYSPGDRFVTFEINGVRCGLLVCFDLRFPELYRQLCRQGVRVLFQSFNNGRMDGPGIHEHIMRQTLQAHAACNGMWISAANSSAWYSRWPSVLIRPDGLIAASLRKNRPGIMANTADPSLRLYDPISPFRPLALKGVLHNGKLVRDARSEDRTSF